MAVRRVLQIGDPMLKAANEAVSDFGAAKPKQVIADLIDTMHEQQLIGIAAPQIGENYRIFVTEPRKTLFRSGVGDKLRIYINPIIIEYGKATIVMHEGCGSVNEAGKFGPVSRAKEVTVAAADTTGKQFRLRTDGILARVIQHEVDHLQGKEFIEAVIDVKKVVDRSFYVEKIRNSPAQLAAAEITVCEEF